MARRNGYPLRIIADEISQPSSDFGHGMSVIAQNENASRVLALDPDQVSPVSTYGTDLRL